ncbi:hypothetical protein BC937DRAFT_88312 [Endogone sp. FLAS-F59071]|nr:hypothetical protein BC937DRAFT_88312 [Endogone sp. FLAS-F59071]|eukprot:RUS18814.1 hypothetical protein BC937DRAFT_88312 [Endogone sp. FLAS-F59071]
MKSLTVGFFATLTAFSHHVLSQGCPKTHSFVGFSGNTTTIGPVTDDCTLHYISLRSHCNYAVATNQKDVCSDKGNNMHHVGSYFTTSASSNNLPVVLYHGPNSYTNTLTQIQADLNPGHLCQPLSQSSIPPLSTAGGNTSVIQTINNTTIFTVAIGTNENYPNPPGWGESYHVNGLETPVLNVIRGTTYTFIIEAGPMHPLYITSSIRGGHSETNETIYAGGGFKFAGNVTNPAILTWMPTQFTPDLVYYMCYIHQKIGWKINVKDVGSASGAVVVSHTNSFVIVALAMIGVVVMLL